MNGTVILEAGRLRVWLRRDGDRFTHGIGLATDEGITRLLASEEGGADDEWPPSSPLQSLHIEDRPGGSRVALLVGMAGACHWSLSITADPTGGQIQFDHACRLRAQPGFLGSTYRVLGQSTVILVDDAQASLETGALKVVIERVSPAELGTRGHGDGGTGGQWECKDRSLVIAAAPFLAEARTVRWKYSLREAP